MDEEKIKKKRHVDPVLRDIRAQKNAAKKSLESAVRHKCQCIKEELSLKRGK